MLGSVIEGRGGMTETEAKEKGMTSKEWNEMYSISNPKPFIIYPENKNKGIWDLFMTLVLIITCI